MTPTFEDDFRRKRKEFDRDFQRGRWLFGVWFVFVALLSLAVLGFMGWAVYRIVQWLTTK